MDSLEDPVYDIRNRRSGEGGSSIFQAEIWVPFARASKFIFEQFDKVVMYDQTEADHAKLIEPRSCL